MGYTIPSPTNVTFANGNRMAMQQADSVYNNRKKITDVIQPNAWADKRCFIIGGGESIKGFDFTKLDGELTIGINRSFEFYNSTLLYMMDLKFHDEVMRGALDTFTKTPVKEKWKAFKGIKVMLCPITPYPLDESLYLVRRIEQIYISLDLREGIFGGGNSGMGALMLAIALGANPIYLLGYDLRVEKVSHWHSGYPGQTYFSQKEKTIRFRDQFIEVAPAIQGLGFDVVNCFQQSGISCFRFERIDEVLQKKEAMAVLG